MKNETTIANEYETAANDFLSRNGLKFRATLSDSKPAPWGDDAKPWNGGGRHYRVTISRNAGRITFDFWGSQNDAENGRDPSAYDVLACISGDAYTPETFADFCAEYGYEPDSIKSLQTFRRADRFAKRLRAFFTEAELQELSEIQ